MNGSRMGHESIRDFSSPKNLIIAYKLYIVMESEVIEIF